MSSSSRSIDAKYRGVRKRKWGKWVSEIRLPNSRERIWLGSYDSAEKAARAFDAALFCLRGNTANFNFPDQPPDIPGGTELQPSEIQAVAAHFANQTSSSSLHHHTSDMHLMDNNNNNIIINAPSSSSSFPYDLMEEENNNNNNNVLNIPDYGIYPGFDDYFMPIHEPAAADYGEDPAVFYDGIYSQDPSFLWNF
ncbi:hypothetical protein QVD17_03411 [Tagetes erecta]|uniref:AP2/ERF domain-containing protein n=1 Tax=Tagetes erecta TaxID=13708 RepID=A0AAD8L9W4_TARER|nr:hypothetical protein QVD17_03411 [Tagetes erecta]